MTLISQFFYELELKDRSQNKVEEISDIIKKKSILPF